jgi:hypothetical protein
MPRKATKISTEHRIIIYQEMRQSTAVDVLEKVAYTRRVKEG